MTVQAERQRGAIFGGYANEYRYRLWRTWGDGRVLPFVMLNPSTADADTDDPTIRKCIGFAKRLGFEGIDIVNLFAYRATDQRDLWAAGPDAVGPENDHHIREALRFHDLPRYGGGLERPVIAAWGVIPALGHERVRLVARDNPVAWRALAWTQNGDPRHPSRLGYTDRLLQFVGGPR